MKRSIKLMAALAVLSVSLFSCSEDPDTSPTNVIQSQISQPFLHGDWQSETNDNTKGYSLHFDGNVAVQKKPDGSVIRASEFKISGVENERTISYGQELFSTPESKNLPNLFSYTKIISLSADELVLEGQFAQTFKRMDPVN